MAELLFTLIFFYMIWEVSAKHVEMSLSSSNSGKHEVQSGFLNCFFLLFEQQCSFGLFVF